LCERDPQADSFTFDHDPRKGLFTLTGPDGRTEHFRDRPAKYLMVEPEDEPGELQPVVKYGKPVIMHLCREEREVELSGRRSPDGRMVGSFHRGSASGNAEAVMTKLKPPRSGMRSTPTQERGSEVRATVPRGSVGARFAQPSEGGASE
jgi:hypothetical protein